MCLHFRQLQDHERVKNCEVEELLARVSALEVEKKTLLLDKTNLNTEIKHLETELQLSQQAKRWTHAHTNANKQKIFLISADFFLAFVSLILSLWCVCVGDVCMEETRFCNILKALCAQSGPGCLFWVMLDGWIKIN